MADAYLAVQVQNGGTPLLLLAQKNIYLPPHGRYQYAAIARNAVQYVLPGGRIQPNEQPAEAAVREFNEDTGLSIPVSSLQPLVSAPGQYWAFSVSNPSGIDVDAINERLNSGKTASQKFQNMIFVPLEEALTHLGNKASYQSSPWVANQIMRALNAGFSRELIGMRANEPHVCFTRAIAELIRNVYSSGSSQTSVAAGSVLSAPGGE